MKTLEDFLGLIPLKRDGRSMIVSYEELCRQITRHSCDRAAYLIVDELEQNGYIETTISGARMLTQKGIARRVPLKTEAKKNVDVVDPEIAWQKFRVLCAYYRDCVKFSEKSQEALFDNQFNIKYFLPNLPYDWLKSKDAFEITTNKEQSPAVNFLHLAHDYEEIFIGYPLSSFEATNGSMVYAPIFLIPVTISFNRHNRTMISLRQEEITVNQSWLEYNVGRENHKSFMMSMVDQGGENAGRINMDVALQALNNFFKNKHQDVVLDPNRLGFSLARVNTVLNSAALFMGDGLKYTKTLRRELEIISKKPASELDKTALAYVFREPPLPNEYSGENTRVPLRFIPANAEQNASLKDALNRPVSKVTGPPGTGKSQVAVNLIANLVYDGESVLFTSKNHKAIHAIAQKSEQVMPGLVRFCSVPGDSSVGEVWYKINAENEKGKAISDLARMSGDNVNGELSVEAVDSGRDDWRDRLRTIDTRVSAVKRMQEINAVMDNLAERLNPLKAEDIFVADKDRLRKLVAGLFEIPKRLTLWQRIISWMFRRTQKTENAREAILLMLPSVGDAFTSVETLKKRVTNILGKLDNFECEQIELKKLINEIKEFGEYEILLDAMTRTEQAMAKNLTAAIQFKRNSILSDIPDNLIQGLKEIDRLLRDDHLPFVFSNKSSDLQDKAVAAFSSFMGYFPAWASTLLSLTRASPCIAGLFDRVVIDEASQCEVPPIIPALYRAKGVTIIGDPAQFPPVITLRPALNESLKKQYHLDSPKEARYDYTEATAYSLLQCQPVMLCEHFRCHSEITTFCNEAYYNGKLQTCTNFDLLKIPRNAGFRAGIDWHDIRGTLEDELNEVEKILQGLSENEYDGTVGVITPFREVANELKTRCKKFEAGLNFSVSDSVNTANGFQGDERDLIIFVLAFTPELHQRKKWYVEAQENAYIYNVAASRARACLIVVGNRELAGQSCAKGLRTLAKVQRRKPGLPFDSPAEKMLHDALVRAGLNPTPQYPLVGRYFDLALVDEKIDIEVDGQAYHLNKYGERKADDIFRDLTVKSAGWRVKRFWVYEINESLENCVQEILKLVDAHHEP